MRRLTAAAAIAAALGWPTAARAQTKTEFGDKGQFVISADRLMPLVSWSRVAQDDYGPFGNNVTNQFTTNSQTGLSFFWGSAETAPEVFFSVPRVGFDYTLIPHLTLGGDIIVFFTAGTNVSTERDLANGTKMTTSADNGGSFVFGVAPRAGYILHLNDMFSLWLRGGVSFYTATASNPKQMDGSYTHDNVDQFALDLEPQFVFTPVPHFGLTATVNGDIPLVGRVSHTNYAANGNSTAEVSASSSVAFIGLTLGMLGYF
jgi:hypothetical protein